MSPEILAPAGDHDSLRAALAAGADAVYFGLDDGFHARARAVSFSRANLASVVEEVHRAGTRAYITVNTLIFQTELPLLAEVLRDIARSGVDAIIVQDPAVLQIAQALCPALELHASTQMTVSSPAAGRFAQSLGVTRVVLPRELSVTEIARFAEESELELEVFVHGALCMSWSGQCFTSAAWGGRSANRGQCAQSCRLPYDLVVDGETRPLGEVRYLLSPRDLAGFGAMKELTEAGVVSLKIEGRYKGPAYVQQTVSAYAQWRTALRSGTERSKAARAQLATSLRDLELVYSRGFHEGFLHGHDHQWMVDGRFPKHRGAWLGTVAWVDGPDIAIERSRPEEQQARPSSGGLGLDGPAPERAGPRLPPPAPIELRPGMGVVIDRGRPEEDEIGGPVARVEQTDESLVIIQIHGRPDLDTVEAGQRVWVTSDPALQRQARRDLKRPTEGRLDLQLRVRGREGGPLSVEGRCGGRVARVASEQRLTAARGAGLDQDLLKSKLGALGGTPYRLAGLESQGLERGLHMPVSALKRLRRSLLAALEEAGRPRAVHEGPVLPELLARARETMAALPLPARPAHLVPLCRTDEQLTAVIEAGLPEVELDWMDFVGLGKAFRKARAAGLSVTVATTRVHKPGEQGFDRRVARLKPDGVLVRHWGALMYFLEQGREAAHQPVLHGDFSLNVTNSLTAAAVLGRGLSSITASHDLDRRQLRALLEEVPAPLTTVVVHHHVPTFHTEHCVYAHLLSHGADKRSCGEPCGRHRVGLRDPNGRVHPVLVDVGCRNTVFNAQAQSAGGLVRELRDAGVQRLRVEFVWEDKQTARSILDAWQELLAGTLSPAGLRRRLQVHEQFGLSPGSMTVLSAGTTA